MRPSCLPERVTSEFGPPYGFTWNGTTTFDPSAWRAPRPRWRRDEDRRDARGLGVPPSAPPRSSAAVRRRSATWHPHHHRARARDDDRTFSMPSVAAEMMYYPEIYGGTVAKSIRVETRSPCSLPTLRANRRDRPRGRRGSRPRQPAGSRRVGSPSRGRSHDAARTRHSTPHPVVAPTRRASELEPRRGRPGVGDVVSVARGLGLDLERGGGIPRT